MWIADSIQVTEPQERLHAAASYTVSASSSVGKDTDIQKEQALQSEESGAAVAISEEGRGLLQKNKNDDSAVQEAIERKMYQEMLESANEAAKAQGEGFADLAKALEIARRILNGDIVPQQDEKFLMEFNSEIYMRVKSMAKQKEDPKEYETLLEEEEDEAEKSDESRIDGIGGESRPAEESAAVAESAETSSAGEQS